MRKSLSLSLLALPLVVLGVTGWMGLRVSEPTYQGRILTLWLNQYDKTWLFPTGVAHRQAQSAIREIGTNALPLLLQWNTARDSLLKKRLMQIAGEQSLLRFPWHSEDDFHALADTGFAALGPIAAPAVPALIRQLERSDDSVRVAALFDLMWIGPAAQDAVPIVVKCLQDTNCLIRFRATRCLATIHCRADLAVPALVQCLSQPGVPTRDALIALGQFGKGAKTAVPALLSLLKDGTQVKESEVIHALERIDPQAAMNAERKP